MPCSSKGFLKIHWAWLYFDHIREYSKKDLLETLCEPPHSQNESMEEEPNVARCNEKFKSKIKNVNYGIP